MIIHTPVTKLVGDDENKVPVLQIFKERYSEDEIVLDYLYSSADNIEDFEEIYTPDDDDEESNDDDDLDWLDKL